MSQQLQEMMRRPPIALCCQSWRLLHLSAETGKPLPGDVRREVPYPRRHHGLSNLRVRIPASLLHTGVHYLCLSRRARFTSPKPIADPRCFSCATPPHRALHVGDLKNQCRAGSNGRFFGRGAGEQVVRLQFFAGLQMGHGGCTTRLMRHAYRPALSAEEEQSRLAQGSQEWG